jgi:hypothetical protein
VSPAGRRASEIFFFFFFFFWASVNAAQLGRRAVRPPIAKIEQVHGLPTPCLLFGGRIRRARTQHAFDGERPAALATARVRGVARFFASAQHFLILKAHWGKKMAAAVIVGRSWCL